MKKKMILLIAMLMVATLTLSACFSNQCTVGFDSDGGSGVVSQNVDKEGYATEPTSPQKDGCAFVGWCLEGSDTLFDFDTPITEDIILVAMWSDRDYSVEFDSNGGSSVSSQIVGNEGYATEPTSPQKDGCTFVGWCLEGSNNFFYFGTPITEDIILAAVWSDIDYSIVFDSQNGESRTTLTLGYGATVTAPARDPSKQGTPLVSYKFAGWSTSASGGTVITTFDKVTDDVTYYAQYSATINEDGLAEYFDEVGFSSLTLGDTLELELDGIWDIIKLVSSDEDIVKVTSDGIEIVGVGIGDFTVINTTTNAEVYTTRFNVYNSIVVTAVKESLKASGYISSNSATLTPSLLSKVEELDLDGVLINNMSDSISIGTLTGLKKLNIANNNIEDASFLVNLSELEELDISNNDISSISSISHLYGLTKLDVSHNNISNISDITYLSYLQELNIGSNNITNILALSSLYDLTELDISSNNISSETIDAISGLSELVSLNVAYTTIASTTIQSLSYIYNITSLNLSGITANISSYTNKLTNITELYLDDCSLSSDDIVALGKFANLSTLSVAGNNLQYDEVVKLVDGLKTYNNIASLNIGGNIFSYVPDFTGLTKLTELDLSDSKNLYSVENLSTAVNVQTVNLDKCIAISSAADLKAELASMPNLTALSIVEGFYYLDRTTFDYLQDLVKAGNFMVRIFEDEWVDSSTIANYVETIYFSAAELILDMTLSGTSYTYNYQGQASRLIISFINEDVYNFLLKDKAMVFDADVFQVDLYGRSSKTFDVKIQVNNRNSSDIFINLYDFNIVVDSGYALEALTDSSVVIGGRGSSSIISTANIAIVCDDITFNYGVQEGDLLYIKGGTGSTGATGNATDNDDVDTRKGGTGGTGYTAVSCANAAVSTQYILIQGGTGGTGGTGGASKAGSLAFLPCYQWGGAGGTGGTGGAGISYTDSCSIAYSSTVIGGYGGSGGAGGAGYDSKSDWNGSTGATGSTGSATKKI